MATKSKRCSVYSQGWCLKGLMQADKQRVLAYVADLRKQNVSSTITLYALRNIKDKERANNLAGTH